MDGLDGMTVHFLFAFLDYAWIRALALGAMAGNGRCL